MTTNYWYGKVTATNKVVLHYIKTSPKNIKLNVLNKNVTSGTDYGINAGFFYGKDLLSIAVMDDVPVNGKRGGYGSGWENAKYPRGTLVWDGKQSKYSVQVVNNAGELTVSDRNNYWAQGGISMNLKDDTHWKAQAQKENMPNMTGKVYRTGLVYNTGLNIWLIVTQTPCTAEEFRKAIKEKIGSGTLVDGIFLDGSGSSQMKCKEISLRGDGRSVVQTFNLKNK